MFPVWWNGSTFGTGGDFVLLDSESSYDTGGSDDTSDTVLTIGWDVVFRHTGFSVHGSVRPPLSKITRLVDVRRIDRKRTRLDRYRRPIADFKTVRRGSSHSGLHTDRSDASRSHRQDVVHCETAAGECWCGNRPERCRLDTTSQIDGRTRLTGRRGFPHGRTRMPLISGGSE